MKNGFNRRTARFTYCAFLALTFSCSIPALAQEPPPPAPLPAPRANSQATTPQKQPLPAAPSALAARPQRECEEPQPTFTGLEYNGPFKKLAVHIVGKPEIRTV